jgi:alcohol dehydrogenase (cytochrome c)
MKFHFSILALALATAGTGSLAQSERFGAQWLTYNNDLGAQRFSPLRQITPENANQLGEVCRVQIDGPTSFHAGLVVSEGVIYTATGRETVALDARNCEVIWKYDYIPEETRCGGSNRGVALHNGRIFRGTCDGRFIALDARDGSLLWKNVVAQPELGESTSAVPLAWQNLVFMGVAGSDLGARGRVMAFDATTGQELWRFHTIPMGDELGADTWLRPGTAKTGGGGVWGAFSLDISAGELFVPVGNPWPDIDLGYRPGENLFTNSIVVLDAFTGKLKWWHQVSPADWKDLDLVAAPTLYRVGSRDFMAVGGKDGYITLVDRDTHEVEFRTPVTTVEDIHDMPSTEGSRMCPGFAGGVEWNGAAMDRLNGTLIVGAVDICFIVTLGENTVYKAGEVNFGGMVEPDGPATGWITALDQLTGAVRWQHHADFPVVAGVTPTASGITFTGDLGGNLFVFDSASGDIVHQTNIGGAMAGGVVTYEIDGRQYLAMNAGNISRNAFGDVGLPSVVIMTLNPDAPATALDATSISTTSGLANGRRLYGQVCASCHGMDGNMITDKRISNLAARMSREEAIALIKDPKVPTMPKLFPTLINEQSVQDVARFIFEELR